MGNSFQGGVEPGRAGDAALRARVAIHGANVEALTGGDRTFRIPIARCSLGRSGKRILVRDEQEPLVIWSDDDGLLDELALAQRGTLKEQVDRVRAAARRRRAVGGLGKALLIAGVLYLLGIPFTRWAVRGGIPALGDHIGESALAKLELQAGVAPAAEQHLSTLAERLRPGCAPSTRDFRVLFAGYGNVHTFSVPPDAVVVPAGLLCAADDPGLVTAAIARELAHLQNRDVQRYVAEGADWSTPLDLAHGDVTRLRDRMLDFADPRLSPGFDAEQESATTSQALALMVRADVPLAPGQDLPSLMSRLAQLPAEVGEDGAPLPAVPGDGASEWEKVRFEACHLIGR
ncbi:MAG: hypothetical protein R3B70_10860 [Polyangiaceae bacterium]